MTTAAPCAFWAQVGQQPLAAGETLVVACMHAEDSSRACVRWRPATFLLGASNEREVRSIELHL